MHKLSGLFCHSSIDDLLWDFVSSEKVEILLLVANMQDIPKKTINHIRIMMEEAELQAPYLQSQPLKLFVLLLHFPPAFFLSHCYPALVLKGWDHAYLDTITHNFSATDLDINYWFKCCCLPGATSWYTEITNITTNDSDPLLNATTQLLFQSIPVLSADMYFGCKKDKSFNSFMNTTEREESLRILLLKCGLGKVICEKFRNYWTPKVMLMYLKRAATFSKMRESTLSITDYIQTQFKNLFFHFIIYMLTRANEHCNLDIIYAEKDNFSPVNTLFLSIFKLFPVPKLSELSFLSHKFHPAQELLYQPRFPFFSLVCGLMEKQVNKSFDTVNRMFNLLEERGKSDLTSLTSKQPISDNLDSRFKTLVAEVLADMEHLLKVGIYVFICI